MFFQGRGNVYLSVLTFDDTTQKFIPGPVKYKICTDSLAVALKTDSFSHQNKCGAVDVEDARGIKSQSVEVTMAIADVQDKIFALGIFGTVNVAGAPGTVTDEELASGFVAGDSYFLGGGTRHRAVTGLTLEDSDSPPNTLTLTTDYVVDDAASGLVRFVNVAGYTQPFKASYGYTDPASVSIFTGGQREFFLDYEFINKQAANDPGSLELYRVRFDPADNLDFQSDELQIMTLKGSALADTSRDVDDTELGQFGRRIL